MRVIGGSARGRRLKAPSGLATRPTADRVRQTLFDVLGQRCDGLRVLDLFAGSGALGIEALSRGAAACVFVEARRRAHAVLLANIEALELTDRAVIRRGDALDIERYLEDGPFDLILADPPYEMGPMFVLQRISQFASRLLCHEGLVVVEHSRHQEPTAEIGPLARFDRRRFGETTLTFFNFDEDRP